MARPDSGHTNKSSDGTGAAPDANDEAMLNMLRDILLRQDREEMEKLRSRLENTDQLAENVNPIVEVHIETLKRKFPKEYRKQVERIVERKLKASQDELLDVIYPVIGKMIRKYVNQQFLEIRETIDQQMGRLFSLKAWKQRLRALFVGVDEREMLLSDIDKASIEEMYIIERDSGLMLGYHSKTETIDRDVVAGMLTAIKSFVEDAFTEKRQDLEMINYGTYNIFLQNFHRYYVAVVLDGSLSSSEKDQLAARILDFAEKEMQQAPGDEAVSSEVLSQKLAEYFD